MRDVPDCLNRRYKALDNLIQDLNAVVSSHSSELDSTNDPSIKLMCNFWSILKADPECNLTQAVKKRMGVKASSSSMFGPRNFSCYMAQEDKPQACSRKTACCDSNRDKICCETPITLANLSKGSLPLSKVLCNLKEAASFDKKCNDRITDLMQAQNQLRDQIQRLEQREKEGVQLLKQADCMWSCMEEAYKKKLETSQKRQQELMKQLREVETNSVKWRKNKKDLEFQMNNLNKCHREITDKLAQKTNDITALDTEIAGFQTRVDSNVNEIEAAKLLICNKKCDSDKKMSNLTAEVKKLTEMLNDEHKLKRKKEDEGTQYVKDAREDLQKICRVLLQKKLENEDLKAETEALREEIELLNQAMDQCKEKCSNKHGKIKEEIKNIDKEIADYKFKCVQCHQCVDTSDVRKMCTDCPRCIEERECITVPGDEHCELDPTMDCVCMNVKQKFLDNVFDNMYTVLARQATTKTGKEVAEAIVKCLKRSRNGKLNEETKRILQNFILTTVKKNLNLTIVGGAVKTRCEMDTDTYNQLMLCLKQVKAVKPPKEDKATPVKKESCRRWGGTSECNCPKGPKGCICTKKGLPPADEEEPLPPPDPADKDPANQDPAADSGEIVQGSNKELPDCGPDCGMRGPNAIDTDVSRKRKPCKSPCAFSANMRAAQCVLGPELLTSSKNFKTRAPLLPPKAFTDLINNPYKYKSTKPIVCKLDRRSRPRERIIEEVMGKYNEVSSLEKVASPDKLSKVKKMDKTKQCVDLSSKSKILSRDTSRFSPNPTSECSSGWVILEGTDASRDMLIKKRVAYVCKTVEDCPIIEVEKDESSESKVSDGSKNEYDARLTVLLHPKFHSAPNRNITDNIRNVSRSITKNSRTNHDNYPKSISDYMISQSKNRRICDVAKQLISDMIVPDINSNENVNPDVEWVTVDSLLKQLTSGTKSNKDNVSNVTNDEIELMKYVKPTIIRSVDVSEEPERPAIVKKNTKNDNIKHEINTDKATNEESSKVTLSVLNEKFNNKIGSGLEKGKEVKIVVDKTGSIVQGYSFTSLTNTSSGNLVMALSDKILDIINKKVSEDPNLAITLNTRESGFIEIDLHSDVSKVNENHSGVLTKSPSGHRQLEISSGFIDILTSKSIPTKVDNFYLYEKLEKIDEQTNVDESDKHESSKVDTNSKEFLMSSSLKQKYKENGLIKLNVRGENGLSKDIEVSLTKTLSGTIAVDVNKLLPLGDIELKFKERPVILKESSSGTFILNITKSVDDSNAMIRKTASGNLLMLLKRPTFITTNIEVRLPKEKMYTLKIKDDQTLIQDSSFVLKTTSSESFVIVADKEFEAQYQKTIDECVGSNNGCNVSMSLISPEMFEVNINDDFTNNNARLVKSASGHIKIIPYLSSKDSSSPKTNRRESKVYSDLLFKLSEPSKDRLRESQNTLKPSRIKSKSDSNLLETVKILTPDQKDLLLEPSVELKKTNKGQYIVVLDKTSKKSLINNLQKYLSINSSQGLIPVTKTKSGDITIALGNEHRTSSRFGSLKVSPSGNIYLLVDKQSVEVFSHHKAIDMKNDEVYSSHFIEEVKHPVNKFVTTTCNGQSDSCCSSEKCICKQLNFQKLEIVLKDSEREENKISLSKPKINAKVWKQMKVNKKRSTHDCINKNTTEADFEVSETIKKCKASPHIVMKPGQQSKLNKYSQREEPCYYFITSVCPHHIRRYGCLSNELIEIKGPCAKSLVYSEEINVIQSEIRNYYDWDNIEQLPQQLPDFLREYSFGSLES